MSTQTIPPSSKTRQLLNKVPEVTIYFWIIKCLCTTIGETMSDNLMGRFAVGGDNATPGQLQIALYKVAAITVIVLIVLLAIQFRLKRYVPIVYWANIVVISVLGTQITDMFEGQGDVPNHMWAITIVSVTLLGAVFLAWWLVERTLSMHSIRTARREMFYWLAILTTFATGTAVGDLIAEKFSLGYLTTLGLFTVIIAIIAALWKSTPINGVLAFWLAYIMTNRSVPRPETGSPSKATKDSTWAPRPRATCSWARSSRSSSICRSRNQTSRQCSWRTRMRCIIQTCRIPTMRPAATWSRRNSDRSCGRSAYRSCPRRPCPSVRRTAPEPGTHGHRRSYLRKSRQADARRCRLCPSWSLNGVTGQEEKTIEAISNANEWTGDRIVALRAVPSGRSLHTSPPGCGVVSSGHHCHLSRGGRHSPRAATP